MNTKKISNEYFGQRVDSVLAKILPEFSRSQLSQWLKNGKILVNNKVVRPKDKIIGNEIISYDLEQLTQAIEVSVKPQSIPFDIQYEDCDIIIINKPAGLVVHPGAGNIDKTLLNGLVYRYPELEHVPRLGLVHRLDKDTTGLLIIARSLKAHTHLTEQMHNKSIEKTYIALVKGNVTQGGLIETYLGRHPHNPLKRAVTEKGKLAITQYSISKRYSFLSLLSVKLLTGRTHQIRVHMAHIKHPIVGDPLYGSNFAIPDSVPESLRIGLKNFNRQALHAFQLKLTHPVNNQVLNFEAPLPTDLEQLILELDSYAKLSAC